MSQANKISKLLGYDKHIDIYFSDYIIEYDNKSNCLQNYGNASNYNKRDNRMNKYIRKIELHNINLLYLDTRKISKKSKNAMKTFALNNSNITALVYTYNSCSEFDVIDSMIFNNLEYLYIKNNSESYFVFRETHDFSALINLYSKTLKCLYIDTYSYTKSKTIQNCSQLTILHLNICEYTKATYVNIVNIIKNARCRDIIINKIYYYNDNTQLRKFVIEIINTCIENNFVRNLIIKKITCYFIFDGNLLEKIEKSKLLLLRIAKTKIYPQEILMVNDFFDVKLNFNIINKIYIIFTKMIIYKIFIIKYQRVNIRITSYRIFNKI